MTEASQQPNSQRPSSPEPLLSVRDLQTHFRTAQGIAPAVGGVSFDIYPDEMVGIVGESGSGKSVTALSILRLIPEPPGKIAGGAIHFGGRNLLDLDVRQLRAIRGRDISMIFQEPMTSLNPVYTIGMQVTEPLRLHQGLSRKDALEKAVETLQQVGIPDAKRRMNDYPHQFSGGMRQRVMIAMALICNPHLLIADEPTTALDVTTQAQILRLMQEQKAKRPGASIMLITHDLAVVAQTCQRVIVMYGGRVQEVGTAEQIFNDPQHPYTQGLLASLPARDGKKHERLQAIPGNVPSIMELPAACKFCTRCPEVMPRCEEEEPPLYKLAGDRRIRCFLLEGAAEPVSDEPYSPKTH